MDAPKSRYKVVIDNATGAPATRPPTGAGRPGASPSPVTPGKGLIDGLCDALLSLAVREWDAEGRAVIAWQWKQGQETRRWDAVLDAGQERRLGRALLGVSAIPVAMLFFVFAAGTMMWLGLALAAVPIVWGVSVIQRLRRETEDQMPI
jgi:hypothetical protein